MKVFNNVVKGGSDNYTPMPNLTQTEVNANAQAFRFIAQLNEEQKTTLQTEEYIEFTASVPMFNVEGNYTFKIKRVFKADAETPVPIVLFSGEFEFNILTVPCIVIYVDNSDTITLYAIQM